MPHYGFEASLNGTAAAIGSVLVERRRITVTLASDPAPGTLQIRHAMHSNNLDASARGDGRGANRGNIRADWEAQSLLHPGRTLRRWLACDYFNVTIQGGREWLRSSASAIRSIRRWHPSSTPPSTSPASV